MKLGEPEAHLLGAYGIFLFLVIASKPAIAKAQVRINPVIASSGRKREHLHNDTRAWPRCAREF